MKRCFPFLVASLLLAVPSPVTARDSLYLRTGELLGGKILRINDREVSIQLDSGGILSFRTNKIRRVRRWLPGENFPQILDFDDNPDDPDGGKDSEPAQPTTPEPPFDVDIVIDIPDIEFDLPPPPDLGGPGPGGRQPVAPELTPTAPIEPAAPPALIEPIIDDPVAAAPAASSRLTGDDWSLNPPAGFVDIDTPLVPGVLETWVEPTSQSLVTLSVYDDKGSPEKFKQNLLDSVKEHVLPRVHRDLPLRRRGEGGFDGWILELEQDFGDGPLRQVSLFVRSREKTRVFVLRCSSPASRYRQLSSSFEESLHSFRLRDPQWIPPAGETGS